MSSPIPEALKLKLTKKDGTPTKEEIGELYKTSYRKYIENFTVQNQKVRYYCNKTMSMRQPLDNIIDDLNDVQEKAMAYVSQSPETFDHYLIAMIFTTMEKTTNMIDWGSMNHKCFWDDFCRETRQLRHLINQARLANLECCHTVVDKANRAKEILHDFKPEEKKNDEDDSKNKKVYKQPSPLQHSCFQKPGIPTEHGIKLCFLQSCDSDITVEWLDHEAGNVESVQLLQTSDSFKLRFLRSLTFCARKALELFILSMNRIEITMRTEFPLEKLEKCDGLNESQLLPHERAILFKSKREFDFAWDCIMVTICRFRLQLKQLDKHMESFKQLIRNPKYSTKISPMLEYINLKINDSLLLRFVNQATTAELNDESYNFTMYTDRTEDIIDIIQDMWNIKKHNFKTIDILIMLIYSALSQLHKVLNMEEKKDLGNRLLAIFEQRDKVKRYLKKSLRVFNHNAFQELPIHNVSHFRSYTKVRSSKRDVPDFDDEYDSDSEDDNDSDQFWVQLPGGFDVTIGDQKEFLVINYSKDRLQFRQLLEEEQVNVINKMISRLFQCVAKEACLAKIIWARATETKSLMKRLKRKDRRKESLVANIGSGLNHIKNVIRLMKMMNALLTYVKKM